MRGATLKYFLNGLIYSQEAAVGAEMQRCSVLPFNFF